MIYIWICFIFAVIAIYIHSDNKKGFLYAFCFLYSILPNDFGIVIGSIPRLSLNRILLLLLLAISLYKRKGNLNFKIFKSKEIKTLFMVSFVILCVNAIRGYAGVTNFLSFIFETFLIAIVLFSEISDIKVLDKCLKALTAGATVVFIVGIIEFLSGINLADCLFIANDATVLSERLGMRRAAATMNGIYLGYYCVFIFPILHYLNKKNRSSIYIIQMLLCVITALCTITRGAILILLIEVVYFTVGDISHKKISKKSMTYAFVAIILIAVSLLMLYFFNRDMWDKMIEILSATLNAFDSSYSNDHINNNAVAESRLNQMTVLGWLYKQGSFLTGLGPNAFKNGLLHYLHASGSWYTMYAQDVGYAAMAGSGGLILLLAYLYLFISMAVHFIKENMRSNNALYALCAEFAVLFLVSNITSVYYSENLPMILIIIMAYCKVESIKNKKTKMQKTMTFQAIDNILKK